MHPPWRRSGRKVPERIPEDVDMPAPGEAQSSAPEEVQSSASEEVRMQAPSTPEDVPMRAPEPIASREHTASAPPSAPPTPARPPPPLKRIQLAKQVKVWDSWKERQMLLERAHKIEAQDYYSQGDIHLLNWVLVGDCECFEKPQSDGVNSSVDMWKCLKNPEFMNRLAHSPVHVYCCKMLDQLFFRRGDVCEAIYSRVSYTHSHTPQRNAHGHY